MLNFNNKTINRAFTQRGDTRSLLSVSDISLDFDLKLGDSIYSPNTSFKTILNRVSLEVNNLWVEVDNLIAGGGFDGNGIYGGSGSVPNGTVATLGGSLDFYLKPFNYTKFSAYQNKWSKFSFISTDQVDEFGHLSLDMNAEEGFLLTSTNFSGQNGSQVQILGGTIRMLSDGTGSSFNMSIADNSFFQIIDETTQKLGLQYSDNYSTTIKANPRSIPDVGTIESMPGYRPYQVYTALLTQTGTNAPVATVLENTTGRTFTYSRSDVGSYTISVSGANIDENKMWYTRALDVADGIYIRMFVNGTNAYTINSGDPGSIDGLYNVPIEIRVYP